MGQTSASTKKKVPSLAPKRTPRKRAANGMSLEINLAYIDSSQEVVDRPPPAPPPKDGNLLDDTQFDRSKWMAEQAELTNSLNSMYQ